MKRAILQIGVLLIGAAIFAAPQLRPELAIFGFVATLPWLFFIVPSNWNVRVQLISFLVLVYLVAVISLSWLGGFSLPAWLVSPLFYIPLFLPTFYLTRWLQKLWPALPMSLVWGLTFTAGEWLRIRISPGEIPFCQLGVTLVPFTKLIQIADIAGASALSTLAAVTTGFVFDLATLFTNGEAKRSLKTLVPSSSVVIAIFSVFVWYGYQNDLPEALAPGPRIEIVQPNKPGWRDNIQSKLKLERAIELTAANSFGRDDVDLVVWPENSVVPQIGSSEADNSLDSVSGLARKVNLPILIDGPFDIQEFSERHRAALLQPDGKITAYSKQFFVPWSEYAPFESALRSVQPTWADSYLEFIKSRNPGFIPTLIDPDAPMTVFRFQGHEGRPVVFASPICYEVLNPLLVNRWYALLEEDELKHFFLINQVNEILVGDSVHTQTLAFCQLRAVEGRVSVIRGTNNGISAAIDPNGRVYDRLIDPATGKSTDVSGVFFPQVMLDSRAGRTFYSRFGDWWPITCLITSLALIMFGYFWRRYKLRATE